MNRWAARLARWWGTAEDVRRADRRRDFNEDREADLCECAWTPARGASKGALQAAYHGAGMHVDGTGECLGRDRYGLRCDCTAFRARRGPRHLRR